MERLKKPMNIDIQLVSEVVTIVAAFAAGIGFLVLLAFAINPTLNFAPNECLDGIPDTNLSAEGVTFTVPLVVQIEWDPYKIRTGDATEVEIKMLDKATRKPLSDVTYDFHYKGAVEGDEINDRYVSDFSTADKFPLPIEYPCGMHFSIFIDKLGEQSFLRTDPEEIEKFGNVSPVFIQFRVMAPDEKGKVEMILFNGNPNIG